MSRIGFETDLDKCIDAMATSIASCKYALIKKQCTRSDCAHCGIGQRNIRLYNSFADMDKLRIDNAVNLKLSVSLSAKFGDVLSPVRKITMTIRYVLATLACFLSAIFIIRLLTSCSSIPQNTIELSKQAIYTNDSIGHPQVYSKIKDILSITSTLDMDINNDGLVNCIDRAVVFKEEWDRRFPFYSKRCILVRNKSPGWHHLFVQINYLGLWSIEPNGNSQQFLVETYWGNKYKSAYNVYNETDKWLLYGRR